ncbi:MAG: transcriptional regulator, MarR family [Acidimicrobiaceae bacterium]|nr:transcriptional regulator, MarR family [Acidimicrobiaceae bacterium]
MLYLGQRIAETARSEITADARGVPTAELVVIWDLLDNGPSGITDIARRTGYVQSRVSTAVTGLIERRWIATRSDPSDGRRVIAYVPDGVAAEAQLLQSQQPEEILQPILEPLPRERRQEVVTALEALVTLFRQRSEPARSGSAEDG